MDNKSIRIEGLTRGDVYATIRGILVNDFDLLNEARTQVKKAVIRAVKDAGKEVVEAELRTAVVDVLENGFPMFDRYSGKETGRTTIAELVSHQLEQRHDRFRGATLAEYAVKDAVARLFDRELNDEIEKLREDLRAQADAVFKAKIVDALKNSLGLR